jgi:SAM-dependent methyltransferase
VPSLAPDLSNGVFDAGETEPYGRALRDPARTLYLRDATHDGDAPASSRLDLEKFLAPADVDDVAVLSEARGPVLDIGCGPGRFVHAAIKAGQVALGIDISMTAVRIAQRSGLPVLRRSVFQDLPGEGNWGTALLIDGNIGIGGDPAELLRRCAELVRDGDGRVLVETHPEPLRDRVFAGQLIDDRGRESLPFPWAEIGTRALRRYAARARLTLCREWTSRDRSFAEYART